MNGRRPRERFVVTTAAVAACAALFGVGACNGGGEGEMKTSAARVVRKSWGGGRWFPGEAGELKRMVEGFLAAADSPAVPGRIVAAIAPHAGYVYSGKIAGYTFRAMKENAGVFGAPDTVVVLGFSHRGAFPGVALMDGDALATPLGEVELDRDAAATLAAGDSRIRMDYRPHAGEHSAENEVPFVRAALPGTKVVVGLLGDHEQATLNALATALERLAGKKKILVVASTDLLHDADYDLVARTDRETLRTIVALDRRKLAASWDYGHQVCCGIGPVLAAMGFAESQGCKAGTLLYARNSGDDFPESRGNWVVGYGAVVFAAPAAGEGSASNRTDSVRR